MMHNYSISYMNFDCPECQQRRFEQKTLDKFQMTIINSLNKKCREVINKKPKTEKISKQRVPSYVGTSEEESSDRESD